MIFLGIPLIYWGIAAGAAFLTGCGGSESHIKIEDKPPERDFLRISGDKIVNTKEETVYLRGVALGNAIWNADWEKNSRISEWVLNREDFRMLRNRGVNAVRYAMTYKWFESDNNPGVYKEQAFIDLEERLVWARENGIYVILDMHNAQGGWQDASKGNALWAERSNQQRLIALWQEIARRYKDDSTVAGYEILNEPHPPREEDWQALANEAARAIREVDQRHILVITNTMVTWDNDWSKTPYQPFTINDNNVLYAAHIFNPAEFTHQGAIWVRIPQGARYPDEVVDFGTGNLEYKGGYYANPGINQDSNWRYLEGNWVDFSKTAPDANLGQLFFLSVNEKGTVWIDDVVLEERDSTGNIRVIPIRNRGFEIPLVKDLYGAGRDFYPEAYFPSFWDLVDTDVDGGNPQLVDTDKVKLDMKEGHDTPGSIYFNGCGKCKTSARLLNNYFVINPEHSYRISGWAKGERLGILSGLEGNWNAFMINAFHGQTIKWDRAYVEGKVKFYADWARENNVPFYIGEFGVMEHPDGDDLSWTENMLQIMNGYGLHWTYWMLRGDAPVGARMELIARDLNNPQNERPRSEMIDLLSRHTR